MGRFDGMKGLVLGVANDHSLAWAIAGLLSTITAILDAPGQASALKEALPPGLLLRALGRGFRCGVVQFGKVGQFRVPALHRSVLQAPTQVGCSAFSIAHLQPGEACCHLGDQPPIGPTDPLCYARHHLEIACVE